MNRLLLMIMAAGLHIFYGCFLQEEPIPPPKDPSTVREITEGEYPSVSPNGKWLTFSKNGALFICDTGGQSLRQLTNSGFADIMPQWSPDGAKIGFVRKQYSYSSYGRLLSIDTISSVVQLITATDDVLCSFDDSPWTTPYVTSPAWRWSPSGTSIAFYSGYDTLTTLSIVRSDGSGTILGKYLLYKSRTGDRGANRSGFCWLPTGERLLCTSNAEQDSSSFFMITVGIGAMTSLNKGEKASHPGCSADGRYIAHFSYQENRFMVYDVQTTVTHLITSGSYSPKLSPDGTRIVSYVYSYNGNPDSYGSSELRYVNFQSGRNMTAALSDWDYNFYFHPSSQWIYLSRNGIIRRAAIP